MFKTLNPDGTVLLVILVGSSMEELFKALVELETVQGGLRHSAAFLQLNQYCHFIC